jgi:hypothetical protein
VVRSDHNEKTSENKFVAQGDFNWFLLGGHIFSAFIVVVCCVFVCVTIHINHHTCLKLRCGKI